MHANTLIPYQAENQSHFFSFEGIEGSGKSTQIQRLKEYLENQGYNVLLLREPGGTEFGESLRTAILESEHKIAPLAEAYLFASSRCQLLTQKILPHLKKEKSVVILDRYIDSSIAYQGFARELGANLIEDIHSYHPLNIVPEMTFYLKIDLETSMQRQQSRGNEKDYFEKENNLFYTKLINGYDLCASTYKKRIAIIDANKSIEEVTQSLIQKVQSVL
jgi:dTMP kinase